MDFVYKRLTRPIVATWKPSPPIQWPLTGEDRKLLQRLIGSVDHSEQERTIKKALPRAEPPENIN